MSDLGRSQADWTKVAGLELGIHLAPLKELRDLERKFDRSRNRIQVREELDVNSSTSAWTLAGVEIGVNTDLAGLLYVRITDESPGAGQATVNLYKATGGGGGDLVATGAAANGAVATLTASNSSGLTGTVTLGTVGASESNDAHKLRVFPDYPLRANQIFDGSETEHSDVLTSFLVQSNRARDAVRGAIVQMAAALTFFLQTRWANFMKSGQASPIDRDFEEDEGEIRTKFVGTLEDGRKNMDDQSAPAGEQTVEATVIDTDDAVFDSQNQGEGAALAPSAYEWAETGLITAVCVDATVGAERFALTLKETATGLVRVAVNELTVKRSFSDPVLGIRALLLTRTLSLDTGSADDFGAASAWTINDESESNTSDGVLYLKLVAGVIDPAKFKVQVFKLSSLVASAMVAESDEGAANATPGLNPKNGSGLSGVAKIGAVPAVWATSADTGTLNLNTFRTEGASSGVPDKFTVAVTVTSRGEFQRRLAEVYGYALNSTAGSPTISESYATAGTFPPYEVADA